MYSLFSSCSSLEVLDISSWRFVDPSFYASWEYVYGYSYYSDSIHSYGIPYGGTRLSSIIDHGAESAFYGLSDNIKIYVRDVYQAYWILNGTRGASNGHNTNWTYDNVIVNIGNVNTSSPVCIVTTVDVSPCRSDNGGSFKLICLSKNEFSDSNLSSDDFVVDSRYVTNLEITNKEKINNGYEYTIHYSGYGGYSYRSDITLKSNSLIDKNGNGNASLDLRACS